MISIKRCIITSFALVGLTALSACGGPEDDFKEAINKSFAEEKICYSSGADRRPEQFPIKVGTYDFSDGPDPILVALQDAGMITLDIDEERFRHIYTIDLTDRGLKEKVWTVGEGFCVGSPEVVEVVRYTYGDNGANENFAAVDVTWQYQSLPSWAKRESALSQIPGMTEPEERTMQVQKSSDGWHASRAYF